MPCRAGITTRPDERRKEWLQRRPGMRNWEATPFSSRATAQVWEDAQYSCEKSGGGADPDSPGATWYGYRFDF